VKLIFAFDSEFRGTLSLRILRDLLAFIEKCGILCRNFKIYFHKLCKIETKRNL